MFLTDRKTPSLVAGYFLISLMFIVGYVLAMKDAIYLIFMIPLLVYFILALFGNHNSLDDSLAKVGWGNKDVTYAIPMGLLCALICLVVGSLILQINILNACFSPSSQVFNDSATALAFKNVTMVLVLNILFQIFIVAPSEETGFRAIIPYALKSLSALFPKSMKNYVESPVTTYTLSTLIWTLFHYPTFVQNGADPNMYIVIILWGIIFTIFMYATDSILTCVIGHAVTNVAILLINENVFEPFVVLSSIAVLMILSLYWHILKGGKIYSKANKRRLSNEK